MGSFAYRLVRHGLKGQLAKVATCTTIFPTHISFTACITFTKSDSNDGTFTTSVRHPTHSALQWKPTVIENAESGVLSPSREAASRVVAPRLKHRPQAHTYPLASRVSFREQVATVDRAHLLAPLEPRFDRSSVPHIAPC